MAASPGPKVLGPDEYDWPESEGGFRNRLVDCYMISAVQVVGAVRAARLAVGGLQMSPLHPRVRFFGGLQADFARAGGGPAPESQAVVMCEHAGAGFRANQQEDSEAAISTCLDAWGEAERPVAGGAGAVGVREAISTQNHVLFGVVEETSLGCAQCGRVNKSWEQFLTLRVQYQRGVENSVQRFVDSFGQGARHDVEAVCTLQGCGAVGARYRQQRLLQSLQRVAASPTAGPTHAHRLCSEQQRRRLALVSSARVERSGPPTGLSYLESREA